MSLWRCKVPLVTVSSVSDFATTWRSSKACVTTFCMGRMSVSSPIVMFLRSKNLSQV